MTGTITLSGAWALYPMTVKWAEEFQKIHPDVRIDIGAGGAGKGMADYLIFLYLGEMIEYGPAEEIFENPKKEMTKEYIKGIIS